MKSILIIGGGVAGLSAGCYGQMNGFRTRILEQHSGAGGVCTSWRRQGYTFDGCIRWLVGSSPRSDFRHLWEELGVVDECRMLHTDEHLRVVGPGGETVVAYRDVDRLEGHLLELAPEDEEPIREMCRTVRLFASSANPTRGPRELRSGVGQGGASVAALRQMKAYASITVEDFAARFRTPLVAGALVRLLEWPDFPMTVFLSTLASFHNGDCGFPEGGSSAFTGAIVNRYEALGGEIEYGAPVERVLVEDDRAVGAILADGRELRADCVISAADGRSTIFDMLEGAYGTAVTHRFYDPKRLVPPLCRVCLGVGTDLSGLPHSTKHLGAAGHLTVAGARQRDLFVRHYCFDPSLAPARRSSVIVDLATTHGFWRDLAQDQQRYEAEKERVVEGVVEALDRCVPGTASAVEVVDVATPLSWERITGNWQGAYEGWRLTPETLSLLVSGQGLARTLPGLKAFYMVGQWVELGGGLPVVALSGREIVEVICRRAGRPFVTSLPGPGPAPLARSS